MSEVSAREHQTHHDDEPEKRHYVGKVTNGILQQRFYQLIINWNPNLYGKEKDEYNNKLKENITALAEKEILNSLLNKYSKKVDREFHKAVSDILK